MGKREGERRSWSRRLKAQVEDEDDVWPAMILTSIDCRWPVGDSCSIHTAPIPQSHTGPSVMF